jgi:Ca2+-binding RTX toxin-like protein
MRFTPDVENLSRVSTGFVNPITVIGNDLSNRIDLSQRGDPVTVQGLGGNDTITGSDWDDSLDGGEGNDTLIGGPGNDTLNGGNGTDFADGGGGQNTHISIEQFAGGGGGTASIAIVSRVLTATVTGNGEIITIERSLSDDVIVKVGSLSRTYDMDDFDTVLLQGLGGNDTITILDPITAGSLTRKVTLDGGAGNDSLTGNSGDDVLRGGDGVDTLVGLAGRDALSGNAGNDQLFGGTGQDFLDGGDNDDFIDASDSAGGDTVLGGNGTADSARVDAGDSTSGVESFV